MELWNSQFSSLFPLFRLFFLLFSSPLLFVCFRFIIDPAVDAPYKSLAELLLAVAEEMDLLESDIFALQSIPNRRQFEEFFEKRGFQTQSIGHLMISFNSKVYELVPNMKVQSVEDGNPFLNEVLFARFCGVFHARTFFSLSPPIAWSKCFGRTFEEERD